MDPELAGFLSAAASALVSAMADDGWEMTKNAILGLWRHSQPQRWANIETNLDDTRAELVSANGDKDAALVDELTAEWEGRLRRLVRADPATADALRSLLGLDGPAGAKFGTTTHLGSGDINQAAHDITTHRHSGEPTGRGEPGPKQ